jgi:sugar lactone lactonase YvrE
MVRCVVAATAALVLAGAVAMRAAEPAEITFADGRIFPESLTSARDGAVYFGSLGHNSVYKAMPGSGRANVWIAPGTADLQTVLGVLADDAAGVLWVCSSGVVPAGATTPTVPTSLKAFRLADATLKASYTFPGGTGTCNDAAVAGDGTLYAADTSGGRVLRLKPGAAAFDVWSQDAARLVGVDGIAILADGAVYVNNIRQSTLLRIPVQADGAAGAIQTITTSQPIAAPDGMRAVGGQTLLLVEGGRLDEVIVRGDTATVRTLREGLAGPTAVTLVGETAYVAEARLSLRSAPADPGPFRAVGVPYRPAR